MGQREKKKMREAASRPPCLRARLAGSRDRVGKTRETGTRREGMQETRGTQLSMTCRCVG